MTSRTSLLLLSLLLSLPLVVTAQGQAAPAAAPAPLHEGTPRGDGFAARLERMLRDSQEKRLRVVLRVHGEEVAGVVQEHGSGWVVLSNQEEQQILLQTRFVERAEIR